MRKFIFFLPFVGAFFSCGNAVAPHLKGKWSNIEISQGKTYEFVAIFREDGTYDGVFNGKVLVSGGHYVESGDTVHMQDPVCNASYTGIYKVQYYSDSLKFHVISDTCTVRRQGTDGYGFKRIAQ